jgi:hypothetical protein
MALPRIDDLIVCIDIDDLECDDEYNLELTEEAIYRVLRTDGNLVYIENDFGDCSWYNFGRFELDVSSRRKFIRNLPAWF